MAGGELRSVPLVAQVFGGYLSDVESRQKYGVASGSLGNYRCLNLQVADRISHLYHDTEISG